MSDKKKYPRADALAIAKELCDLLLPVTERLEIAGSLRREKKEVSDVEILYVPKFVNGIPKDMFEAAEPVSAAGITLVELLGKGVLAKRPNARGSTSWGELNKLAIHVASGIPVDLFATEQSRWWVSLVIRTGGKETNLELTTGAQRIGRKLHAYGNVEALGGGEMLIPNSEQDVFRFCGVPYREPRMRK